MSNQNTNALAKTDAATKPANTLAKLIEAKRESFAMTLPKHLPADRFVKIVQAAITRTPKLAECTATSVLMSVASCAEVGLEPNTPLGHAYLIPFENRKKDQNGRWYNEHECQVIFGFKGLLALARRSGEIVSVDVAVVHARDRFVYTRGDNPSIQHEPHVPAYDDTGKPIGPIDPGPTIAAYMVARMKDGGIQREVMYRHEIEAVRRRAKGAFDRDGNPAAKSPWTTDFDEMERKTVFRRGWKWIPQSTEMARAFAVEDENDPIEPSPNAGPEPIDVEAHPVPSPTAAAAAREYGPELRAILDAIEKAANVDALDEISKSERVGAISDADYQVVKDAMDRRFDAIAAAAPATEPKL